MLTRNLMDCPIWRFISMPALQDDRPTAFDSSIGHQDTIRYNCPERNGRSLTFDRVIFIHEFLHSVVRFERDISVSPDTPHKFSIIQSHHAETRRRDFIFGNETLDFSPKCRAQTHEPDLIGLIRYVNGEVTSFRLSCIFDTYAYLFGCFRFYC